MEPDIIRLPEVSRTTGLARSTIYLRIEQGLLPKPVSLGGKAVGWPASEISQINNARIAGKSNEEISVLVQKLMRNRLTEDKEVKNVMAG